jgi:hypothetical protein
MTSIPAAVPAVGCIDLSCSIIAANAFAQSVETTPSRRSRSFASPSRIRRL